MNTTVEVAEEPVPRRKKTWLQKFRFPTPVARLSRREGSEEREVLGEGFFVFRRGRNSNRIKLSIVPWEQESMKAAITEAERLAKLHPGVTFQVYGPCYSARSE